MVLLDGSSNMGKHLQKTVHKNIPKAPAHLRPIGMQQSTASNATRYPRPIMKQGPVLFACTLHTTHTWLI